MKKLFQDAVVILIFAALWWVSGYFAGAIIDAARITSYSVSIIIAALNMITGLVLLLLVTHDPQARHIFYGGPSEREEGLAIIGCIWIFPLSVLIVALPMWLLIRLFSK
jgi:hypothetical protein